MSRGAGRYGLSSQQRGALNRGASPSYAPEYRRAAARGVRDVAGLCIGLLRSWREDGGPRPADLEAVRAVVGRAAQVEAFVRALDARRRGGKQA